MINSKVTLIVCFHDLHDIRSTAPISMKLSIEILKFLSRGIGFTVNSHTRDLSLRQN